MSLTATPEIAQEARRLLAHLTPSRVISAVEGGGYGIFDARSFRRRGAIAIPHKLLEAFLRADLIERRAPTAADPRPTHYVLSKAGAAFLARFAAPEDPFAAQHRAPFSGAGNVVPFARRRREAPLAWLKTRRGADGATLLSREEIAAGERLHADYNGALLSPRPGAYWPGERVDTSRRADYSPTELCDRAHGARRRFWGAVDCLGPGLAPLMVAILCHLKTLEEAEAKFKLPARSAKSLLKAGLRSLAVHYGLVSPRESRAALRASFSELPDE